MYMLDQRETCFKKAAYERESTSSMYLYRILEELNLCKMMAAGNYFLVHTCTLLLPSTPVVLKFGEWHFIHM